MIYKKSKIKIYVMIISIFLLTFLVGLFIILFATRKMSLPPFIACLFVATLFMFIYYPQLRKEATQFLEVNNDKIVLYDNISSVTMLYTEINKITYHGTKLIGISERITIHSKTETINIDYNYKKYLKIWKEVITLCLLKNSHVTIDKRIRKRTELTK